MNIARKILFRLIEELPDNQIPHVIDYVSYLRTKKEAELFKELQQASESSLQFWLNDKDDEVWNNA